MVAVLVFDDVKMRIASARPPREARYLVRLVRDAPSHETTDAWWTATLSLVCGDAQGDARACAFSSTRDELRTRASTMPALAHAAQLSSPPPRARGRPPRARRSRPRTAPRRHPRHHVATPPERAGARRAVAARGDFAEIDAESSDAPGGVAEGRFGPDAILLVGFSADETRLWRAELDAIEAGFVRLVTCTKDVDGRDARRRAGDGTGGRGGVNEPRSASSA